MTEKTSAQLVERANSLRDTVQFHLEQFKKETGFFANISITKVEFAGYGDQANKILHTKVEISIDL